MTGSTPLKDSGKRLVAIDALRAVVMVLMIFVNDLWTLTGVPVWLEHAAADANEMGLADVVFPAFLFIVGLSVPYAVHSRRKKGDNDLQLFLHISSRTVALLIMGFFHVNMEGYSETALLSKPLWQILVTISFFLIWLDYSSYKATLSKWLKVLGMLLLIGMAVLFESDEASGIMAMKVQWWGILGLIGWAYFISSCVFLFSGGKLLLQILVFLFFLGFSIANNLGWLDLFEQIRPYIWIAGDGAMPALPMAGIITALLYRKFGSKSSNFWVGIMAFSILLFLFGYFTNPLWGISKIRATPSWTSICAGITAIAFALMVYLTEVLSLQKWYLPVKPAGTSTLTCYLLPYIHYALLTLMSIPQLPLFLRTGEVGLLKSLCYALIIVMITGLLEKRKIRLKI
ncbi:DUF5009 domain-containing protein [Pedobacter steynii]|uniref:Uncharacterized protein n=1 Tax=Pedobacter steynii TaxID=430522 RepID=A0A1D7QCX7_9SPHI|nr:DUF5009 domain-containing protein [Pedobacter steynii]AOM76497.1 hypothetical protein BFS30_04610 [Pedobacter steynii]